MYGRNVAAPGRSACVASIYRDMSGSRQEYCASGFVRGKRCTVDPRVGVSSGWRSGVRAIRVSCRGASMVSWDSVARPGACLVRELCRAVSRRVCLACGIIEVLGRLSPGPCPLVFFPRPSTRTSSALEAQTAVCALEVINTYGRSARILRSLPHLTLERATRE